MELSIRPFDKNLHPLGAVIIRGASVEHWLHELRAMNLSLSVVIVYPLPGRSANSVWGCLVVHSFDKQKTDIGRNAFCQFVHNFLFIPEGAVVYPQLSPEELLKLLSGKPHLLHPEIGLVELPEPIDWTTVIERPIEKPHRLKKPAVTPFMPMQVRSFQIKPVAAEEALQAFDEKQFPQNQKFTDKPLNPFEKAKLFLLRQLFTKGGGKSGAEGDGAGNWEKLAWLERLFPKKLWGWMDGIQQNLEELERRNQKHVDRLMDLLKNNPAEALKYAVPLDNEGTTRGGWTGSFNMEKRWFNFSLFDGWTGGGGGGSVLGGDSYQRLYSQYTATAQELIKQGDYRKAAFVYLKLLKNPYQAAQTLEQGGLLAEAAAIYLKHCNNKEKAADCLEKGHMTEAAIDLYKELGKDEKVGDLYLSLHKKKEAFHHYQKVANGYEENLQYLKASLLYKAKMENTAAAQTILLQGWTLNRDAFNCLNNYFANMPGEKEVGEGLQHVYAHLVNDANRETFLRALQQEYGRHAGLSEPVRDMAYEIISAVAGGNPSIVAELKAFNKSDKQLVKDTLRFKLRSK